MITKINKLKNCGVFKDFSWNELDKFKKCNLIYGWNYSGKTTLSRLFQDLQFKKETSFFLATEFQIVAEKDHISKTYTQKDLAIFPFDVKVFNAQYIRDVFISDDMDLDFQPISFYLGDTSGQLDKMIKKIANYNEVLYKRKKGLTLKYIDEFGKYDKKTGSKFTDKAKEIRDNYLDSKLTRDDLNISHFRIIVDNVKSNLSDHVLSTLDRDITKIGATVSKDYNSQKDDYEIPENLRTLSEEVKSILEDTAPKSFSLPELNDDIGLFNWVQNGLKFHENETSCKFCTKALPDTRIADLNSYYSKKLKEIQVAIKNTGEKIKLERESLRIAFPDKKNLSLCFQVDYQNAVDNFKEKLRSYDELLDLLENDLKRKTSDYFNNVTASEIAVVTLVENFSEINKSAKAHNDWLAKFDENKNKALTKILNHYVAEYLEAENYNKIEIDKNRATEIISNIDSLILFNDSAKIKLESQLKCTVRGQEELNSILEILLHRNDVRILISNNKFTLERCGYPANNLSEGEKSAIAFAYFLTELKSLRTEEPPRLHHTIIFIDDPISSLDSNHIFQIGSLIKTFFKESDYAQLFISTHNFEFFSVMLDTNLFGYKSADSTSNKRALYFIKRRDDNTSEIKKLPLSFSSYKSEYVGLFYIIKEFNELEKKEDFTNLLLLPNAVRRFMELYTLMRFPSGQELDKRVAKVFNPDDKPLHNTKLLHWFSHQNQFEKVQQHDDKILQIEDVISELLEYLETKDELHWKGLINE